MVDRNEIHSFAHFFGWEFYFNPLLIMPSLQYSKTFWSFCFSITLSPKTQKFVSNTDSFLTCGLKTLSIFSFVKIICYTGAFSYSDTFLSSRIATIVTNVKNVLSKR